MTATRSQTTSSAKDTNGRGRTSQRAAAGPSSRLADSLEAVERFPVGLEAREQVMAATAASAPRLGEIVEAVESDAGLAMIVLRSANQGANRSGTCASIPAALELLKPSKVLALAGTAPTFDPTDPGTPAAAQRFRIHALLARRAAECVARSTGFERPDELTAVALLHDIGWLVITRLHPGSSARLDPFTRDPEQRLREERERLGIDHALVGGVLARRWRLPPEFAGAIERHHSEDAEGLAALVGLADLLAHHLVGDVVSVERMLSLAARCGLDRPGLRRVLYEMPKPPREAARMTEPCPLSNRELEVLRRLGEGKVYKQIAEDMQLSVSTVRTHLHNVYGKIGAVDRAQAVLTARDCGWI
jgi:DNA-binding CsgD family transcriptional regulator/HD-like signal output (HDOD) protein